MDILDGSLLLVVEKVRAWIHWKDTSPECSVDSCECYGDCGVCSQCNSLFDAVNQHYQCSICGVLFCFRCVQIDTVSVASICETREPLRSKKVNSLCIPCFTRAEQESILQKLDENLPMGARNDVVGYTALEGHPKANPLSVPYDAPSSNANRQDGLPQEQKCSLNPLNVSSILSPSKVLSPVSLQCSIRSDHGHGTCNLMDADDAGLNYLTPRSEYYQDYDTDSNSSFNRNDVYSFRSANSSPFDSPVTASCTPERIYSPTPDSQTECPTYQDSSHLIQEKMEIVSSSNEDAEQTTYAFHMNDSPIINQGHTQKIELILDLEYNDIIWFPPKENAQDEVESITFESDDEDIDGYCSMLPSINIEPDSQVNQERLNDLHKEPPLDVIHGHFKALVSQLLRGVGIGAESDGGVYDKWLEIVTLLASQAAKFIKPDTSGGGSMDPCDYVKVKCIASGNPTESTLIKGVVCTTKIKHKRMISQCRNPKLLLLRGALEYQRLPDQLSSIGTLLDEEKDYLKAKVSKIEAYGPNVLLVEKSVSPCAQEYLLDKDISLMLNVKRSVLERIARCTGAQIIPSIDSLTSPRLGYCEVFRIERVVEQCQTTENPNKKSNKTLMFFEGCPKHLGCTVLLRGASHECLKKIKQVVQYAVFAAYHLSLETSFFADEGASLPHLPAEPLDTSPGYLSKLDRAISMVPKSVINTYNDMVTSQTFIPPNNLTSPKLELAQSRRRPSFDLENEDIQSPHEHADPITLFPLSPTLLGTTTFIHLVTTDSLNSLTALNNSNGSQCKESNNLTMPSSGDTSMVGMHERTLSEEEGALNMQREINITQEKTNLHAINPLKEPVRTVDAHQGIIVLLFSRCMTTDTVCERPQLLRVKFYGSSDKPLGKFLGDNLFNQTVHCRSCNESTEAHVQFYIHQQGSLTVWVKQTPWKLPGAHEGKIWMWHRCYKCEPKDRISPTKKKMMSDAAWGLSFGKFLELSFSNSENANRVAPCGHSMQRDCLRYYGCGDMVAAFRYAPSNIFKVFLPSPLLEYQSQVQQEWITKEADDVSKKVEFLYVEVFNALQEMGTKSFASDIDNEPWTLNLFWNHMEGFKHLHRTEKIEYDTLVQSAATAYCQQGMTGVDCFELAYLRRCLFVDLYLWDRRLLLLSSLLQTHKSATKFDLGMECKSPPCTESSREGLSPPVPEGNFLQSFNSLQNTMAFSALNSPAQGGLSNLYSDDPSILNPWRCVVEGCAYSENPQVARHNLSDASECKLLESSTLSEKIDMKWTGSVESLNVSNSHPSQSDTMKVGSVVPAKENYDIPHRKVMAPLRVCSFDSVQRFQEKIPKSPFRTSPSMRKFYYRTFPSQSFDFVLESAPSFLPSSFQKLNEGPRFLFPSTGRDSIVVPVRENEPTSIIAYVLSCKEYESFVTDKSAKGGPKSFKEFVIDEKNMSQLDSGNFLFRSHGSDINALPSKSSNSDLPKSPHFKTMFAGDSSSPGSGFRFSVTCYFAREFDSLRRKCSPNVLEHLRSLSRCQRWNAEGGKSKVYFAKTLDERFIVKQVKKIELESFEEFSQDYFNYVSDSLTSGSPMCLAKIVGMYQVCVKNLNSGKEDKMDLMVMENIFFGRSMSKTYDLKGSIRFISPDKSKVLLDENLLKVLRRNPIFLGSRDKHLLERAVWNDTSFLASVDVMDYSLLVGVDEKKKELVLGIIDYMRQYTWDKHLETWVKASGILGGPKNASPTVVSPKQYKKRFRKAMSSYFLMVPDQWST